LPYLVASLLSAYLSLPPASACEQLCITLFILVKENVAPMKSYSS